MSRENREASGRATKSPPALILEYYFKGFPGREDSVERCSSQFRHGLRLESRVTALAFLLLWESARRLRWGTGSMWRWGRWDNPGEGFAMQCRGRRWRQRENPGGFSMQGRGGRSPRSGPVVWIRARRLASLPERLARRASVIRAGRRTARPPRATRIRISDRPGAWSSCRTASSRTSSNSRTN